MGQLERYGLYVLVVVIALILGVAIFGDEPSQSGAVEKELAQQRAEGSPFSPGNGREDLANDWGPVVPAPGGDGELFRDPGNGGDDSVLTRIDDLFVDPAGDLSSGGSGDRNRGGGLPEDDTRLDEVRGGGRATEAERDREPGGRTGGASERGAAAPAGIRTVHRVQRRDNAYRIAQRHYGTSGHSAVQALKDANPGVNWTRLQIGQEIQVPEFRSSAVSDAGAPVDSSAVIRHTIRSGDTIAGLAGKYLGSQSKTNQDAILALNPGIRPKKLYVGKTVLVPKRSR